MNHFNCRPWTSQELDALRSRYLTVAADTLSAELRRSRSAIFHKATRLGLVKNRRWTAADDNALRYLWGELPLRQIADKLGRSPLTIYWRAQKIGLSLGVADGSEYLSHAAARAGYTSVQLRRILKWAGVRVRRAMSRNTRNGRRVPHIVVPFDVDEAIAAWHRTETVEEAARRHGICGDTLRRWLIEAADAGAKVPKKPTRFRAHWRVETVTLDEVVRARLGESRRAA